MHPRYRECFFVIGAPLSLPSLGRTPIAHGQPFAFEIWDEIGHGRRLELGRIEVHRVIDGDNDLYRLLHVGPDGEPRAIHNLIGPRLVA